MGGSFFDHDDDKHQHSDAQECKECGGEYPPEQMHNGVCDDCRKDKAQGGGSFFHENDESVMESDEMLDEDVDDDEDRKYHNAKAGRAALGRLDKMHAGSDTLDRLSKMNDKSKRRNEDDESLTERDNMHTMPPKAMSPHDNDVPADQQHGIDVYAASKAYDALDSLANTLGNVQGYKQIMQALHKIKSRAK